MNLSVREKFEQFHQENPQVFDALVRVAFRAHERGMSRVGINHLAEVVRWEMWVPTTPDEHSPYKLCNTYRPYYARLIMRTYPELAPLFEIRQMHGETEEEREELRCVS